MNDSGPRVTADDWNGFWVRNSDSRYVRKSWSKIRVLETLRPFLKPGMKVLDAGCGSGFFSKDFLEKGCKVTALDYSAQALDMVRRLTEGKCAGYLQEDLLDPDWGLRHREGFDLIFTDGLLEHFAEGQQKVILGNFKKAKTPGGLVATFVPNLFSWWEIVRPWVMPGIHEKPFTLRRLRTLHEGFEIVRTGGLSVLPFAASPERLLGRFLGMILYCVAK